MLQKRRRVNNGIRYSEAFKMTVVRELEENDLPYLALQRKYGVSSGSVQRWAGKYGNGSRGKVIRVHKPEEMDENKKLKERVKRLERLLADANIDLSLERAYTRIACERAGIKDVEAFKKKSRWPAGHEAVEKEPKRFGVNVRSVCKRLGMSRQNYYEGRRQRQGRAVDSQLVVELVKAERAVQPRLGTRKLRVLLKPELAKAGVKVGRDRFFKVLREAGLLVEPLPREYVRTTNSYHCLPVFRNKIKELEVSRPNQVWVGDLTYVRTEEDFLYLALLTDKYSRKIVGYHCGDTLEAVGCVKALEMALESLPAGAKPIHHSDQGTQYCCHEYVNRLTARKLEVSMTESNHCAENALAERMNGILKSEYGLARLFKDKRTARLAVAQAVELYNRRRPHTALNYQVPERVHEFGLN